MTTIIKRCEPWCSNAGHDLYVLARRDISPVLIGLPHDVQRDRVDFDKIILVKLEEEEHEAG